jgi:hypothetical protein
VIIFADSVQTFISPRDTDTRPLWQMISDEAGVTESVLPICGPGYNSRLFAEYSRFLTTTDAKPVVILSLSIRLAKNNCLLHPAFGHQRSSDFLRALPDKPALRSMRARIPLPNDADFEEFYKVPFPTSAGDLTTGDYIARLRDPKAHGLDPEEEFKLRMQYYHEGPLDPDGLYRSRFTEVGKHLQQMGVPVVVYAAPLPIDAIRDVLGEQVLDHAETEYSMLEESIRAGYTSPFEVVRAGHTPEGELMDPLDASEHLNDIGRMRVAKHVGAAVREALANV